ncbi:MAG: hypothetical protein IT442_08840 [Phycisphaeraceae bacterium]|nr:hypothetical protein [Phycisphaeraceae bacterium]
MDFVIVNVAWGAEYVRQLLEVSLPSSLAEGNLPALAGDGSVYHLYTVPRDVPVITAHPAYAALQKLMPVRLIVNEQLDLAKGRYGGLTACHNHAIQSAYDSGRALCILSPDSLLSAGAMDAGRRRIDDGAQAVMVMGIRLVRETAWPALRDMATDGGLTLAVPPRRFARLILDHVHPFTESMFWESPDYNRMCSHLYWRVGRDGILGRCFYLHPLMVSPQRKDVYLIQTIDTDYVMQVCPDHERVVVIEDSDELATVELTSLEDRATTSQIKVGGALALRRGQEHPAAPPGADLKAVAVAFFAQQVANALHQRFIRTKVRIHAEPLDESWRAVEEASDRVVAEIEQWMGKDAKAVLDTVFGGRLE